jgi:hypothetical protein
VSFQFGWGAARIELDGELVRLVRTRVEGGNVDGAWATCCAATVTLSRALRRGRALKIGARLCRDGPELQS